MFNFGAKRNQFLTNGGKLILTCQPFNLGGALSQVCSRHGARSTFEGMGGVRDLRSVLCFQALGKVANIAADLFLEFLQHERCHRGIAHASVEELTHR